MNDKERDAVKALAKSASDLVHVVLILDDAHPGDSVPGVLRRVKQLGEAAKVVNEMIGS